jgi:hypothetical protein
MDTLNALIIALLASSAVGIGVSFLIQLGKLFIPKWFPDESADNWRLGLIVLTAAVVLILKVFGVVVELPAIEAAMTSLASLGAIVMPLLVLLANVIAKATYKNALQGVSYIGISHTPK